MVGKMNGIDIVFTRSCSGEYKTNLILTKHVGDRRGRDRMYL
jgi:hypothetical protein